MSLNTTSLRNNISINDACIDIESGVSAEVKSLESRVHNPAHTSISAAKIVNAAHSHKFLFDRTVEWIKFAFLSFFTAGIYTIHYFAKRLSNLQNETRAQALDLDAKNNEILHLKQAITKLQSTQVNLTAEAAHALQVQAPSVEINNENATAPNAEKLQLEIELRDKEQAIQSLHEKITGLTAEVSSAQQENTRLIGETNALNKDIIALNKEKAQLEEYLRRLADEMDIMDKFNTNLIHEKASITDLQRKSDMLYKKIKSEFADSRAIITRQKIEIEDINKDNADLKEALDFFRKKADQKERTTKELNDAIEKLNNIIAENEKKISQLEKLTHKRKETIRSFNKEGAENPEYLIKAREKEINDLKKENSDLKKQVQDSKKKIATLEEEKTALNTKINEQGLFMGSSPSSGAQQKVLFSNASSPDENCDETVEFDIGDMAIKLKQSQVDRLSARQAGWEKERLDTSNVSDSWSLDK